LHVLACVSTLAKVLPASWPKPCFVWPNSSAVALQTAVGARPLGLGRRLHALLQGVLYAVAAKCASACCQPTTKAQIEPWFYQSVLSLAAALVPLVSQLEGCM
jgi:hypothetical protein